MSYCGQPFMPIRKDQNYCRPWCPGAQVPHAARARIPLGPPGPRCPVHYDEAVADETSICVLDRRKRTLPADTRFAWWLLHKPPTPAGSFLGVGPEIGHRIRHARCVRPEVVTPSRSGGHLRNRAAAFPRWLYATPSMGSSSEGGTPAARSSRARLAQSGTAGASPGSGAHVAQDVCGLGRTLPTGARGRRSPFPRQALAAVWDLRSLRPVRGMCTPGQRTSDVTWRSSASPRVLFAPSASVAALGGARESSRSCDSQATFMLPSWSGGRHHTCR